MTPNFPVVLASALIPFLVATVWFHKSLFGGEKWHSMADMPEEKATPVKPLKLVLSIFLNVFLAFGMYLFSIHETGVFGMVGGETELMKTGTAAAFLAEYGGRFHTWTHGLAHGLGATLFYVLPILGYVAIFEKKSIKYFFVYLTYWLITLKLMSIVICLWGASPLMGKWFAWNEKMQKDGVVVDGHALDSNNVRQVSGAERTVTDRAGSEIKELVGGYYIVKAADLDGAMKIAEDYPDYDLGGTVEIREVMVFDN